MSMYTIFSDLLPNVQRIIVKSGFKLYLSYQVYFYLLQKHYVLKYVYVLLKNKLITKNVYYFNILLKCLVLLLN